VDQEEAQWLGALPRSRRTIAPAAPLRGAIIRSPVNHSKPLSREEIADFVRRLDSYGGNRTTAIALRLLLLTFVRTVEMRKAEWSEFNFDQPEWRIPAAKMKMRRIHIVPLARSTVDLLLELRQITGAGRWLFPNTRRPHDVMSATTVNRVLEYMGYASGIYGLRLGCRHRA